MAPKRKGTEDTIDKRNLRRPQIVLRTLPPIVFTSPTNPLAFQLTMSVADVKPQISPAPTPEPEARPSYERDFGFNTHEWYRKPEEVERQFKRVHDRVDDVKKDLKDARNAIDEKIDGLETRLTNKIDAQKVYIDGKFEQQEKTLNQLVTDIHVTLNEHTETFVEMDKKFVEMDKKFVEMDKKIDRIQQTLDQKIDRIQQTLEQLLAQGGVPPITLPSTSSQAPSLSDSPNIVIHAAPASVGEPLSPPRHDNSSVASLGAASADDQRSLRRKLSSVFLSIEEGATRGLRMLRKKDHPGQ